MAEDRLILRKQLKDGRVLAANLWDTGCQELVYPSLAAFERAKEALEKHGKIPDVAGFTAV